MARRIAIAILILPLLAWGCTPEAQTRSGAEETAGLGAADRTASLDPVARAQSLVTRSFEETGEAEHVSQITFTDGLLRVHFDIEVDSLAAADVYGRVCSRLSTLITSEETPTEIVGVQTFGPDGAPVIGTSARGARCWKFYL